MRTFDVYLILFIVTSLYALLLSQLRHHWEPDFTWLEVVIGVALCLTAPYADHVLNGPYTAELYQWRVWQSFLVGGLPIVIWSIARTVRAWQRISKRIWRRESHGESSAEALAVERRGRAQTDD